MNRFPPKKILRISVPVGLTFNKFALLKFHGVGPLLAYYKQNRRTFTSSLKLYDRVRFLVNLLANSG